MKDFREIESLCLRLRISERQALDALQLEGRTIVSDLCTRLEDIASGNAEHITTSDVEYALAHLKARFASGELIF